MGSASVVLGAKHVVAGRCLQLVRLQNLERQRSEAEQVLPLHRFRARLRPNLSRLFYARPDELRCAPRHCAASAQLCADLGCLVALPAHLAIPC